MVESALPKISIIVPSLNQGLFLSDALQSLLDQEYQNLQVIVQDGGSCDETGEVANEFVERYPGTFQLYIERDSGDAQRVNLGLSKTSGEIIGFVSPDSILHRGCLHRVTRELDQARNRYIVMGRCHLVGERMPEEGIEHPCEYIDRFHLLAIWLRRLNSIPILSVFSYRVLWEKFGGFEEDEPVPNYELFCRFTKQFDIHKVDEVWATWRMHCDAKLFIRSEAEQMTMAIAASRKHWGKWWSILRWRCEISYLLHNPLGLEKAREHLQKAEAMRANGTILPMLSHIAAAAVLSPRLTLRRLFFHRFGPTIRSLLCRSKVKRSSSRPRFADGWIGPRFSERLSIPADAQQLIIEAEYYRPRPMRTKVTVLVAGAERYRATLFASRHLEIRVPIQALAGREADLQIISSDYFCPKLDTDRDDFRELSLRIIDIHFQKNSSSDMH